jgi:hypothetical protein
VWNTNTYSSASTNLIAKQFGLLNHHPHFRARVHDAIDFEWAVVPLRKKSPRLLELTPEEQWPCCLVIVGGCVCHFVNCDEVVGRFGLIVVDQISCRARRKLPYILHNYAIGGGAGWLTSGPDATLHQSLDSRSYNGTVFNTLKCCSRAASLEEDLQCHGIFSQTASLEHNSHSESQSVTFAIPTS